MNSIILRRLLLLVHCVGVVLSASYYQREYSGYSFTIPGFNDAERRTQVNAQTWCNQNGSKLLAITNQSIQSAAVAFINDSITQRCMTGNTIITDGQRSNGDWTWINGTTSSPSLQIGGQGGGSGYSYVYLYVAPAQSSLGLYASTPSEKKYFICEGQVFCGNGYQIQSQCFKSFRDDIGEFSWFEARNRCLQRGGDLATFEFIATNDDLNALNGSWLISQTHYWIGLRREWWTWQSINSNVTYSQWSDGRPIYDFNQQCLCLLPNVPVNDWKWSECQCSKTYQFVCISSSQAISISSSSFSSSSSRTATTHSGSGSQTVSLISSPSTKEFLTCEHHAENSIACTGSCVGVGLGVGLGVGIPALLGFLIPTAIAIHFKRKLRKYESFESTSAENRVKETPEYESMQRETTVDNSSSTYQELNVIN